jgi:hypothetical protein
MDSARKAAEAMSISLKREHAAATFPRSHWRRLNTQLKNR